MKGLLIVAVGATLVLMALSYRKHKKMTRLFVSLGLFAALIGLGIVGGVMRAVMPLYLAHLGAIVVAWAAAVWYVLGGRLLWYLLLLPVVTVVLFWVLEYLEGSRHEAWLIKGIRPFLA